MTQQTLEGNIYHVLGPPGTGKTSYLTQQIERARGKHGADGVLVVSFTRAAAGEIAGRIGERKPRKGAPRGGKGSEGGPPTKSGATGQAGALPGPSGGTSETAEEVVEKRVGTLHAILYHALDKPKIAELNIDKWNQWVPRADYRINVRGEGNDDFDLSPKGGRGSGDDLTQSIQKLRARMIPPAAWPSAERTFFAKWCEWKTEAGFVDFTELIEIGLRDGVPPPRGCRVGVVDEAQDFTRLELAILARWAKDLETVVFAYDDDQSLYSFKGATPEVLIDADIAEDHKRVLAQSYRVPVAIHRVAEKWIERCQKRAPKEYRPRPGLGEVVYCKANSKAPLPVIKLIEADLARNQTVMILATCSYMLSPTIKFLREAAIPFWNPFRITRGDWNPLRHGLGSAGSRILSFAQRNPEISGEGSQIHVWTAKEIAAWSEHMTANVFGYHGAKTELQRLAEEDPKRIVLENDFFHPEEMPWINAGSLDGFLEAVLASKRRAYEYPIALAKRDVKLLADKPKVIVGTVHSVKGAEADVVYLFPDLSPEAGRRWSGNVGSGRDDVRRVFYVGFTRARERLVLCEPAAGGDSVRWIR